MSNPNAKAALEAPTPGPGRMVGMVLRAQSGFFWVQTAETQLVCRLRGRLKRERSSTDLAVIGDLVEVSPTIPGEGAIEQVFPRRTRLARRAAGSRGAYKEDVLVANLDQVLLTFGCAQPEFVPRMLDRYLVICELAELEAVIIATKLDLVGEVAARAMFAPYERIGYPVCYVSNPTGVGLEAVQERLRGRISVVTGKSGVGKSSLLNALDPSLKLATAEVSTALNKGRHTTTVAELLPLVGGGYVADTPGIREIGLWQIAPEELAWGYRELRPFLEACYFASCSHLHEPNCAVREAVARGQVDEARYLSYTRLREG